MAGLAGPGASAQKAAEGASVVAGSAPEAAGDAPDGAGDAPEVAAAADATAGGSFQAESTVLAAVESAIGV